MIRTSCERELRNWFEARVSGPCPKGCETRHALTISNAQPGVLVRVRVRVPACHPWRGVGRCPA